MPHLRVARGWLLAAGLVAVALVLGAPFMGQLRTILAEATGPRFAGVVLIAVAATVMTAVAGALLQIRDQRWWRYAALAAALTMGVGYAMLAATGNADVDAVERVHFVEYGLITAFFYRAWRPVGDGSPIILPAIAGVLVGTLEEWFQWFIPARVGEVRDVLLNSVAIGCGLLFSIGLHPPNPVTVRLAPESRRQAGRLAAVALLAFAGFVHSVHLGYEISDAEAGVFRSRYTAERLAEVDHERAARWATNPPVTWSRLSREDQFLSEGIAHVQRRNDAWQDGEVQAARLENLILEKYYAAVLDTPSFTSEVGHRWPASQRADAESRTGPGFMIYVSDALPYPVLTWPKWIYWTIVGLLALIILRATDSGSLSRRTR